MSDLSKTRCLGATKSGFQCQNMTSDEFCFSHQESSTPADDEIMMMTGQELYDDYFGNIFETGDGIYGINYYGFVISELFITIIPLRDGESGDLSKQPYLDLLKEVNLQRDFHAPEIDISLTITTPKTFQELYLKDVNFNDFVTGIQMGDAKMPLTELQNIMLKSPNFFCIFLINA